MSATKPKGFSQLPHGFHKRLLELKGARLHVWLTHRCMEGKSGESYPSLDRIVEYTGLNRHTVTDARKWLRENGWLTSSGQKHTDQGKFSIPIEHTTIPEPVGGKPTHGAGGKPTHGAGRKPTNGTVSGFTASGKPTTEVDPEIPEVNPEVLEVAPCAAFSAAGKEREGEVSAAQPKAPIPKNPKPSLSPSSLAAGFKDAQTGKDGDQQKPKRIPTAKTVEDIETRAKLACKKKIEFSVKSKTALMEALNDIPDITDSEIDHAIGQTISRLTDEPSYTMFGAKLAANLVSDTRAQRSRKSTAEKKARDTECENKWRKSFYAVKDDLTIDLDDWINAGNWPDTHSAAFPEEIDYLIESAIRHRQELREAAEKAESAPSQPPPEEVLASVRPQLDPDLQLRQDLRAFRCTPSTDLFDWCKSHPLADGTTFLDDGTYDKEMMRRYATLEAACPHDIGSSPEIKL